MRKATRTLFALAFLIGLSPTGARADGFQAAGCMWMFDGCACSPFGQCPGLNCDHNGTSFCRYNAS